MSLWYRNNYWLLGDGADEEAKRWVAENKLKKIVYSSPKAVEMEEIGRRLSPQLPIPPQGFLIVVVSEVDVDGYGLSFGVANSGGEGGWIERKEIPPDDLGGPEGDQVQTAESVEKKRGASGQSRRRQQRTGRRRFLG